MDAIHPTRGSPKLTCPNRIAGKKLSAFAIIPIPAIRGLARPMLSITLETQSKAEPGGVVIAEHVAHSESFRRIFEHLREPDHEKS